MQNDIDFRRAYIKANELLVRAGVSSFPFDIQAFVKQQPNCVCRTFKKARDYGIDIEACFGGIEKGSPVVISTLGCQEHQDAFLDGFKEMKKRIEPPIIIVYGDMISGMTGRFIHYRYESAFSTKVFQLRMKEVSQIFDIEEVC